MGFLFLIALGLLLIGIGGKGLQKTQSRQTWQEIPIRIEHAGITRHKDIVRTAVTTYYFPEIHFAYEHRGQHFHQKNFGIPKREYWNTDSDKAQALLDSILARPVAYLNPADPAESCLMRGTPSISHSHNAALIVAGILLILSGAGVYWLAA